MAPQPVSICLGEGGQLGRTSGEPRMVEISYLRPLESRGHILLPQGSATERWLLDSAPWGRRH